jgi:hypothetical protein
MDAAKLQKLSDGIIYMSYEEQCICEGLQQECHQTVEWIMENQKGCTHQDAMNVWLFIALARLTQENNKLRQELSSMSSRVYNL